MRGHTTPRIVLLDAAILVYAFTAAAFRSDWPSITGDPMGLVRLAIPVLAALAGLLLRDAYAGETRAPYAAAIDVAAAFGCALLTQGALFFIKPDWMLPRWAPTQGGMLGLFLLAASRSLFHTQDSALGPPMNLDESRWRRAEVDRRVARARKGYFAAAVAFSLFACHFLLSSNVRVRAGSECLLAGAVYMLWLTMVAGQRDFLRWVQLWYYASLLPAFALWLWESKVYEHHILLLIVIGAELTHRWADGLRREIATSKCFRCAGSPHPSR